jgi:hypothetical protein
MCFQEVKGWATEQFPWLRFMFIPPGCTGRLQPADVGLQKPVKDVMKRLYGLHVLQDTQRQLSMGMAVDEVRANTRISHLKPLVPSMLLAGFERLTPALVKSAWERAGLAQCFTSDMQLLAAEAAQAGKLFPAAAANGAAGEGEPDPAAADGCSSGDDELREDLAVKLADIRAGRAVDTTAAPARP